MGNSRKESTLKNNELNITSTVIQRNDNMSITHVHKYKEIIQNAMNLVNGIAFNSHKTKFGLKNNILEQTPGPGYYQNITIMPGTTRRAQNLINTGGSLISNSAQPKLEKSERINWNVVDGNGENIGPGSYHQDKMWIKGSYNVTMPNNMIHRRKEIIIKARLESQE